MNLDSRIYIAGHRGMVGSAIARRLVSTGYTNLVARTHAELDLTNQAAVTQFLEQEKPDYIFLAAAQVGGIHANNTYRADDGVDAKLHMVMDYDLWWRLFKSVGPLHFVEDFAAVNREHEDTKTRTQRRRHYQEAMGVARKHYGRVPLKWWLAQPYAVWYLQYALLMEK